MAEQTSLSIIVADLCANESLVQTVESILNQSAINLECLVVTSRTDDELRSMPLPDEPRLRIVAAPAGANWAQAVNIGLQHSLGDVVGVMSSEDVVWGDGLVHVQQAFAANPELEIAYGRAVYVDERAQLIRRLRTRKPTMLALSKRSCLCSPAVYYKKEVLLQAGEFDDSLESWAHYDMWFRALKNGTRFTRLPHEIAGVRLRQIDKDSSQMVRQAEVRSCEEAMRLVEKHTGSVGVRWPLRIGSAAAAALDLHRQSVAFDKHVLSVALQHAATSGRSLLPASLQKSSILATHVRTECSVALRHPRVALRLLPDQFFKKAKRSLPLRIFRLRVDEPHTCKLPSSYLNVPTLEQTPSISIVTPNLNQGAYIERTIRSVIDQDYPNLQYVVQDGLSKDESLDVIRKYENRIAHWESTKDSGQSNAINMGLQHTDGDIMAYLNSDDTLVPGSLHYVANYFNRHPEIDVVYGYRLLIDEQDKLINRWVLPAHDDAVLPWADYIPQETMFWRRRAWEAADRHVDESFHFAMDWDLILRFRAAGMRFARLPRFLGAFRITDSQKTNQLAATTGAHDIAKLRKRELGFVPSETQIGRVVRPYVRKQRRAERRHAIREAIHNRFKAPIDWDYTEILAQEATLARQATAPVLQRAA
jgi:glycosyltransferase involved in cell wall biosynthesis